MRRRPPLRQVARRRALRARASHLEVSPRLAGLLALSIARWGYQLPLPPALGRHPPLLDDGPRTALRKAYAWADMQAYGRLDVEAYRASFERAVTIYDEILTRHLPPEERLDALLPPAP